MILDRENMVSYKQAVTVTAVSTDVIDLGPPHWAGAAGSDKEIPMVMAIDEVFTAAGAATLRVQVQSSPVEGFGSGVVTHYDRTFALSELSQAGQQPFSIGIPPDARRYLRGNYTVATGPMTAGKITLGVTASRQTNR